MTIKLSAYWQLTEEERELRRKREREKYAALTPEERRAKARRVNERAKARDSKKKRSEQQRAYRDSLAGGGSRKSYAELAPHERRQLSLLTMARFSALPADEQIRRRRKYTLTQLRIRAKRDGVPCTVTLKDIAWPETCPILGEPLVHAGPDWRWHPSVDRLEPAKGYVPGNCFVISRLANTMKNCATREELLRFVKNIVPYLDRAAT